MNATTRIPPTTAQILAAQAADAKRRREAAPPISSKLNSSSTAVAPAKLTTVASQPPDTRTELERYFDEVSPASGFAGRLIKFDHQSGVFSTGDDGEPIADGSEYIAVCDQVLAGWIRFNGSGLEPDRILGLLYDGFIPPPRETLSDPQLAGTDGDVWKRQHLLPLQHKVSRDLFTFSVVSKTGNAAVTTLLRSYDRMRRTRPDKLPVIRLKATGYQPNIPGVGYQYKPILVGVGEHDRNDTATPDTSVAGDVQDAIVF